MENLNKQRGISILGLIALGIIIILALNYFHLSIKIVADNSVGQGNTSIGGGAMSLWNAYLAQPVSNLWNNVVLPLLKPFVSNFTNIISQPGSTPN